MRGGLGAGYVAAAMIGAVAGLQLITLWIAVSIFPLIDDAEAGRPVTARAEQLDAQLFVIGAVSLVLTILAGIAWARWLSGLMDRFSTLGLRDPPATPRSAFIWTLVPIYGHLYRMPQIVQDAHDIQARRGLGGRKAIVRGWRVLWIAQWAVALALRGLDGRLAVIGAVIAVTLTLAAAAMAVLVIRDVEGQQERLMPATSGGMAQESTAA